MGPSSLLAAFCLTFIIKTFIGSRLFTIVPSQSQAIATEHCQRCVFIIYLLKDIQNNLSKNVLITLHSP